MRVETIYLKENRKDVTLTTYLIEDSAEMLNGKNRPAILICPGGGYLNCADTEAEPIAIRFASMGYHALVLRYSTYGEGKKESINILGKIPVKEQCLYPTQIREIGMAFLYIHKMADEWNIDTDKIVLCGFSAGAHNVAMYANSWDKEVITEYFNEEKGKFKPAALITGYMLCDYLYFLEHIDEKNEMDQAFFRTSNTAFMGVDKPSVELAEQLSPSRNVSKSTPPTFLWALAADKMVPIQNTLRMAHALADHDIPFELHIFEKGEHGIGLATQASAAAKSQIFPDAAKWVALAECWLEKRFALDLPDRTPFEEMVLDGTLPL